RVPGRRPWKPDGAPLPGGVTGPVDGRRYRNRPAAGIRFQEFPFAGVEDCASVGRPVARRGQLWEWPRRLRRAAVSRIQAALVFAPFGSVRKAHFFLAAVERQFNDGSNRGRVKRFDEVAVILGGLHTGKRLQVRVRSYEDHRNLEALPDAPGGFDP